MSQRPEHSRKEGAWFSRQPETVKAAIITAVSAVLVGVLGMVGAVVTGVLQFRSPGGASGPVAPTATVTTTVTAAGPPPSSAAAGQAPSTGAAGGSPHYLADMNPSGDAWLVGSWKMAGKVYAHSFGEKSLCGDETIVVDLGGSYRRLTATVGVADTADAVDRDTSANFSVYVDADDDDQADSGEQIVSRGGLYRRPAPIDISFAAATKLILVIDSPGDCFTYKSFVVWGDPRVY